MPPLFPQQVETRSHPHTSHQTILDCCIVDDYQLGLLHTDEIWTEHGNCLLDIFLFCITVEASHIP
jgi:hypothetical protein